MLQEYLEKNYKNLVQAHDFARIGSWEMDLVNHKNKWSEEACSIYGITPQDYHGTYNEFLKFVHPDDIESVHKTLQNPFKLPSYDMEYRIIRTDGAVRTLHQLIESTFDQEGNLTHLSGTIQDITEKKELQKKLGQSQDAISGIQRLFQVLVQQSSDVFEIISPDGTIQFISPAVEKITGYKPEERIGKNTLEFLEEGQRANFSKMMEYVLQNPDEKIDGDFTVRNFEGREVYLALSMSNQLSEPSIQGIVINWRDITERVENQREIEYIATHDELTKLPNRVYLKKKISQLCNLRGKSRDKNTSFALIMLDIDGFKFINDALGYQLGDQLIIQVAERLRYFLDDQFLCRYSGDQFAMILEEFQGMEEYERVAKDLIELFQYPFKVDMYELDVTTSMGISIFPDDEQLPDSLINYANIALLRSKREGKNRYEFYSSDIGIQIYKQLVLRNDLIKAIEKNQFRVYYQPQIKLKSNDILAAEALIRWEHPDWGLVSPNEFIPLAEETGFIINLGNWMLRQVCKNYKDWMDQGLPPIKVSVNYSSIQFFEKNFVENIKNIIDEYELDPHFLIMEITESVLMKNAEKAISDINRLQALGIQVALDDFGTGFSCLAYLNSFNIDILKIDRSFIKNVFKDDNSSIITRSVIDLAQELKIKLVAEGIENFDQLSYLRELNCFMGQGFLYSKPVPQKEFEDILKKEKCIPITIKAKEKPSEEKRKFLRIKLPELLVAEMTILDIPGEEFKVGTAQIGIKNIGSEGMCFASDIKLPVNHDLVLEFSIPCMSRETKVRGTPVWIKEVDDCIYEYGVTFIFDKDEKTNLASVFYSLCKDLYIQK
ncbi:EAL and GGDEF domain-containing protein [Sinanaerobacter chloroacetimidivorans]|uniref:EAL domain-containing protein n=1 Tax=Sinanaerobacter chloroacetimidivorans TaxID=2818044 RepID=A0A8J8B191_9FIRM|nr:EAL domain-containing protein [Sinanaerobacter chloroacetimidivorans]MBR0597416.1 EAL domain-containing protein [Sinanaerobacter chloroacetimidivorans]